MPIPESAATLKSYFQTGDKPTQAQFADFIDTMYALFQEAIDTAEAAEAAVTALTSSGFLAKAFANTTAAAPPVVAESAGIASITSISLGGGQRTIRITFTTAFADTNYTYVVTALSAGTSTAVTQVTKNVAYLEIAVVDASRVYIAFFHA